MSQVPEIASLIGIVGLVCSGAHESKKMKEGFETHGTLANTVNTLIVSNNTPAPDDIIDLGNIGKVCIFGEGDIQKIFLRTPDNRMLPLRSLSIQELEAIRQAAMTLKTPKNGSIEAVK